MSLKWLKEIFLIIKTTKHKCFWQLILNYYLSNDDTVDTTNIAKNAV